MIDWPTAAVIASIVLPLSGIIWTVVKYNLDKASSDKKPNTETRIDSLTDKLEALTKKTSDENDKLQDDYNNVKRLVDDLQQQYKKDIERLDEKYTKLYDKILEWLANQAANSGRK